MSERGVNWASLHTGLHPAAAIVLRHLAWRHNARMGYAYPKISEIAERCNGIGESTVRRVLKQLEKLGLITIKPARQINRKFRNNIYILNFDRVVHRPRSIPWARWWPEEAKQYQLQTYLLPGEGKWDFKERQLKRSVLPGVKKRN